ncbi:MAG: hypothetical protein LBJ41_00785 [Treponema sp.]|jgi:hypothetical protein|nr:hypothetical protein [Treponema sp.]
MKKIMCVMLLAAGLSAALSAQNFAVGGDAMPLLKGFTWSDGDKENFLFALAPSFEYHIIPHFSVGATMDLWFGQESSKGIFYFGLAAQGRWYPLSEGLDKLFVGTLLGFNVLSYDGKTKSSEGGMAGLVTGLKAGWKLMFGSIFVEPFMSYIYTKTPRDIPTYNDWQAGLTIGATF